MPWKVFKNGDEWCLHKLHDDGSKGQKVPGGCHPTEAEAEKHMRAMVANVDDAEKKSSQDVAQAELVIAQDGPQKCAKCGYEQPLMYTMPFGVTTLADAMAAQDAQEQAKELEHIVVMFRQVVDNILYSTEIKDKTVAIRKLADELAEHVSEPDGDKEHKSATTEDPAKAKREGSPKASDYLVVEDADKPDTWHLPVKEDGQPNHRLMGAAFAALHGGYRGKEYTGPNKQQAIAKLRRLYEAEGMAWPSEKSLAGHILELVEGSDDLVTVKSLGDDRIGAYAILWGDAERRDVTKQWFDPQATKGITTIFDALGRLPLMYDHALDGTIKSRVVGMVDVFSPDALGMWYEAQVRRADEYDEVVRRLVKEGKLKTSTQTLASAMSIAKSGLIDGWVVAEVSLTPTPAEPRMVPVEVLKAAYAEIGCEDIGCRLKALAPESQEDGRGTEKVRLQIELEGERLALAAM